MSKYFDSLFTKSINASTRAFWKALKSFSSFLFASLISSPAYLIKSSKTFFRFAYSIEEEGTNCGLGCLFLNYKNFYAKYSGPALTYTMTDP